MIANIPKVLKKIYPLLNWDETPDGNEVFLTFDDGPIPEVTPWVLEKLKEYDVKATFFCIGDNVLKHPKIYQRILDEGHAVGNHTHKHLKGWNTDDGTYLKDIENAGEFISSNLFRPPYGRIKKSQIKLIQSLNYHIIMWSILSGDYNKNRSPEACFNNVKRNLKPGSVVVFHDSIKADNNMRYALEKTLIFMRENNFKGVSIKR
ncbi:polysaccharide deacetylase family protein [Acidiluteibacter ferrifornacis]|uniref:Polysaccharide deacetylase family protein n=1 Tax=Acidiluteibacter ferrifornacis TaxID=2692424 RepID=A0A6N9NJK8_9FLAO|nr:polysaccharide deacetylase family protein [Acidiluteibacter ferrifornacis]NBG64835.1 polysaccharide deacetylase family protein [Acidiluteibacter ferrifornacis]